MSALASMATAGVGYLNPVAKASSAVTAATVNAGVGNAITQGVAVQLHMQDHFDWRNVAVASISDPKLVEKQFDMFGRSQIFRVIGFAMLLCFCHNIASAKDMPRYGMFVYSNFCTSAMSGDLYGNRITLRRLIDDDTLIYEYTDGSTHVVVADNLILDPKSRTISFEVHAQGNLNTIVSGQFSGDGGSLTVHGMLFNEMATVTLKLVMDFSAPIQDCK